MEEIGFQRRKKSRRDDTSKRHSPVHPAKQGSAIRRDDSVDTTVPMRSLVKKGDVRHGGKNHYAAWGSPISTTSGVGDVLYGEEAAGSQASSAHPYPTSTFSLKLSNTITMSDYDRVRSKLGVELTDLSALALFSVGQSSAHRSAALFHNQQWSYMHYVPARYGITPCLTATTNAVLAKVRMILSPDCGGAGTCSGLYGVALRAVQEAIGNEMTAGDADVLCATQLLSLYEVSNISFRFLSIR